MQEERGGVGIVRRQSGKSESYHRDRGWYQQLNNQNTRFLGSVEWFSFLSLHYFWKVDDGGNLVKLLYLPSCGSGDGRVEGGGSRVCVQFETEQACSSFLRDFSFLRPALPLLSPSPPPAPALLFSSPLASWAPASSPSTLSLLAVCPYSLISPQKKVFAIEPAEFFLK